MNNEKINLKLQTRWTPLYTEQQRAAVEWGNQNRNNRTQMISKTVTRADERNTQRQKAYQRANRSTKAPFINNTAKLQENLYKLGFFDQGTSFAKAVDGIIGRMTNSAIQRARNAGYIVDEMSGTVRQKQIQEVNDII